MITTAHCERGRTGRRQRGDFSGLCCCTGYISIVEAVLIHGAAYQASDGATRAQAAARTINTLTAARSSA
jgi:hypothetical protein